MYVFIYIVYVPVDTIYVLINTIYVLINTACVLINAVCVSINNIYMFINTIYVKTKGTVTRCNFSRNLQRYSTLERFKLSNTRLHSTLVMHLHIIDILH